MRKRSLIPALLCCFIPLLAASPDPKADPKADEPTAVAKALVGAWQLQRSQPRLVISFEADGTYHAISKSGVLVGRWALVDEHRIATWSDDTRPRRVNAFRLEDDSLVIIDKRGLFHKHRRIDKR